MPTDYINPKVGPIHLNSSHTMTSRHMSLQLGSFLKYDNVLWIRGNFDGRNCFSGITRVTYIGAIHLDILNCFRVIYIVGYGGPKLLPGLPLYNLVYNVSSIRPQMLGEFSINEWSCIIIFILNICFKTDVHKC